MSKESKGFLQQRELDPSAVLYDSDNSLIYVPSNLIENLNFAEVYTM